MESATLHKNLIPFDDTYVLYNGDDILSFGLVYFTLLPIFVMVFIFSWFINTRELEACILAAGHVVNDIVNNIVKNIIKEERPVELFGDDKSFQKNSNRSGYGMPSAHSQFMGFLTGYMVLRILFFWRFDKTFKGLMCKYIGLSLLIGSTLLVAFSRVYLQYHSLKQVSVGVALGLFLGSSYFVVIQYIRRFGFCDWLMTLRISEFFAMKDSSYKGSKSLRNERKEWQERCRVETVPGVKGFKSD
ncbi:hypothetical protein QEN19_003896 [Hanseniaspora menglaensis]